MSCLWRRQLGQIEVTHKNYNMAKVRKILGNKIIRTHLSRVTDWNIGRDFVKGHILLENGMFIQVSKGKYHIVVDGQRRGAILKTSPAFRKMK